jgi:integrase
MWFRDSKTRRLAVGALRRVLHGAVSDGLLETNPAVGARTPSQWLRREQKGVSPTFSEVLRFTEQALSEQSRWHELFLAALHAGLRLGELQALRWRDLQLGRDPRILSATSLSSEAGMVGEPAASRSPRKTRGVAST